MGGESVSQTKYKWSSEYDRQTGLEMTPNFTTWQLCELGNVIELLKASVSSSINREDIIGLV